MSYNLVDSITGDLTRVAGGIIYADNPIGSIIPFGSSAIPSGYLLCNGQALSRTAYSELFAVIGTAFGTGDGSSTFNVPDLREMAIVGAGENTNLTIAAHDVYALGEFKDDQMQGHWHSSPDLTGYYVDWESKRFGPGQFGTSISNPVQDPISDGKNGSPRVGSTTHGKQVGVNYIIKAKHVGIPAGFIDAVDKTVKDVYGDIIPADASASNKLVTMNKVVNSIVREGKSVLYNLNNVDNIEVEIDIAKSGYKPIAVSLYNTGTHLWFAQGMYFDDTVCNLSLRGVTPASATNAECKVLVTYIKTS